MRRARENKKLGKPLEVYFINSYENVEEMTFKQKPDREMWAQTSRVMGRRTWILVVFVSSG